jgi:hypothetical protein
MASNPEKILEHDFSRQNVTSTESHLQVGVYANIVYEATQCISKNNSYTYKKHQ